MKRIRQYAQRILYSYIDNDSEKKKLGHPVGILYSFTQCEALFVLCSWALGKFECANLYIYIIPIGTL